MKSLRDPQWPKIHIVCLNEKHSAVMSKMFPFLHFTFHPSWWSLAGVSRSVTLVIAYIMTVTGLGWQEALAAVKAVRPCAGPNLGFQRQLQEFEATQADEVSAEVRLQENRVGENISTVCLFLSLQFREWLRDEYKDNPFSDEAEIRDLLARVSKVNGEELNQKASTPPGGTWPECSFSFSSWVWRVCDASVFWTCLEV